MHLTKGELLNAYGRMRAIRAYRQTIHQGAAASPASTGEACAAGTGLHLNSGDMICAAKPDGALRLGAGAKLSTVLDGEEAPTEHAPVQAVGDNPAQALGTAIARRALYPRSVTVCHLTEGAAGSSRALYLLQAARDLAAPVVFIMPHHTKEFTEAAANIRTRFSKHAESLGIDTKAAQTADFFSLYHAAALAMTQARAGRGPAVVEAHITEMDALNLFKRKALDSGLLRLEEMEGTDRRIAHDIDFLRASRKPKTFALRGTRP